MRIFLWNIVEKHVHPFNREPRKILKKNENRESSLRRISDRVKTRQVGREGKFALESCGYKPCATAYHPTLSTSPIESTVTRCTTCIPPIDGDNRDTQCRRDVPSTRPSPCREDERGILNSRGERRDIAGGETRRKKEERNPWERAVYKPYPRLLRLPREIPRETFTSCWFVARFWPSSSIQPSLQATHQYDFPECYAKWIVWSSRGRG